MARAACCAPLSGALLIAMLIKSMEILGAQFWDQLIVVGALVALGSALGAWLTRRRTRQSNRADACARRDQTPGALGGNRHMRRFAPIGGHPAG